MSEKVHKEWLHCNECGRNTEHSVVTSYRNKEFDDEVKDNYGRVMGSIDGFHDWEMLECGGCKTVCLRSKEYFSEWHDPYDEDPFKRAYFPARNNGARVKPHWFDVFINLNEVRGHFISISYEQVYALFESKQYLGAMLTARALLETVAIENCDGDPRTFEGKLNALHAKELIRSKQIEFLNKAIYDAGSATMHRGYNPSAEAVTYVLDAIEQLLYTIYIEPIADKKLAEEKPQRKGSKNA